MSQDAWSIDQNHPTLPASSRDFLRRMLPAVVTAQSVEASILALVDDAVQVLVAQGHSLETVSAKVTRPFDCHHGPEVEAVQLRLLSLGKALDKQHGQGNPVILHALALEKLRRTL